MQQKRSGFSPISNKGKNGPPEIFFIFSSFFFVHLHIDNYILIFTNLTGSSKGKWWACCTRCSRPGKAVISAGRARLRVCNLVQVSRPVRLSLCIKTQTLRDSQITQREKTSRAAMKLWEIWRKLEKQRILLQSKKLCLTAVTSTFQKTQLLPWRQTVWFMFHYHRASKSSTD